MPESTAYTRRGFAGAAAPTRLTASVASGDTQATVANLTSWAGISANGPFTVIFNRGLVDLEEHCEATGISGNNITGLVRGLNGTTARNHGVGATVEHGSRMRDFDEANAHVAGTALDHHTQYISTTVARDITAAHRFAADSMWHDITATAYGAVRYATAAAADAGTDATAAINAAIDAAYPGGVVYVPPGWFRVEGPVVMKAGVHLHGAGWKDSSGGAVEGSHFKKATADALNMIENYTAGASDLFAFGSVERVNLAGPDAAAVPAASAAEDQGCAIKMLYMANAVRFADMNIAGFRGSGIYVKRNAAGVLPNECATGVTFDNVRMQRIGRYGYDFAGGSVSYVTIVNPEILTCRSGMIRVKDTIQQSNLTVVGGGWHKDDASASGQPILFDNAASLTATFLGTRIYGLPTATTNAILISGVNPARVLGFFSTNGFTNLISDTTVTPNEVITASDDGQAYWRTARGRNVTMQSGSPSYEWIVSGATANRGRVVARMSDDRWELTSLNDDGTDNFDALSVVPSSDRVNVGENATSVFIGAATTNTRIVGASGMNVIVALPTGATPSVAGGSVFGAAAGTTITDFTGGYEGQLVVLRFSGARTVTHNANIFLSGSVNYVTKDGDTLTLICDSGGNWHEIARKVA